MSKITKVLNLIKGHIFVALFKKQLSSLKSYTSYYYDHFDSVSDAFDLALVDIKCGNLVQNNINVNLPIDTTNL